GPRPLRRSNAEGAGGTRADREAGPEWTAAGGALPLGADRGRAPEPLPGSYWRSGGGPGQGPGGVAVGRVEGGEPGHAGAVGVHQPHRRPALEVGQEGDL